MSVWIADRRRERIEDLTDLSLGVACVVGIAVALVSLVQESQDVGARGEISLEPIGRLSVAVSQVRRRAVSSLVWRDVSTGAPIYDGDTMFVPPLAYARVTLDDGSELVLDPESLTVIEKSSDDSGLRVSVARGTVSGLSAGPGAVTVRAGSVRAVLGDDAQARLSVNGEEVAIDVLAGAGEVDASGEKFVLTPETGLRVNEEGARTVRYPAILTAPSANARIGVAAAVRGIELRWSGELVDAELWLASDRQFRDVVRRPATAEAATLSLTRPGRYFWKVVDANGSDASAVARFWIVPPEPPKLLSPVSDFTVQAASDGTLRLGWSAVNGAGRYRVELVDVSDQELDERRDLLTLPKPQTSVWTRETAERRVYVPLSLAAGKYRWRVVPIGGESGRPSPYRSLRLTEAELLQAPEVLDPSVVVE